YSNSIPPFIKGKISFEYSIEEDSDTHTLRFQVSTDEGDNWNTLFNKTSGSGSQEINLEERGYSDEQNFAIRFYFKAKTNEDKAYVDNFQLGNYEFCWSEKNDNIDPEIDQDINLYLNPDFADYMDDLDSDNVSLWYNINDDQVDQGSKVVSTQRSNNFTLTIPSSAYSSSDTVYYEIWINHESTQEIHKSSKGSFTCLDKTPPTVKNIESNVTTYENDILLSCYVEDNQNGVGLENVTLYINNATETDEDILVLSNYSDSIPEDGGYFGFLILSEYLSAEKDLHYQIHTEDKNGNQNNTMEGDLDIGDNREPHVSFNDDNSESGEIDCFEDLFVNYSITEPLAGSGLKDIQLLVKIGDNPPENNNDYNFSTVPLEDISSTGGVFNFNISYSHYAYNKTIYHFVNATDNYDNNFIGFNNASSQPIDIIDNSPPFVSGYSENFDACSYEQNKTLKFDIVEPSGGSGIKNDSIILSYQLNENLTSPQSLETNISKYGGYIDFQLNFTDLDWKYGDIIYFQLTVSDRDENAYSTETFNFKITDLVSPEYENLTLNTNGWVYDNYKLMNFTVEDPDFDDANLSSGIDSIQLYYNPGEEPSATDYRGVRLQPTVIKEKETYTFNLTLNESMFQTSPIIYYRINVTDVAGNSLLTEPQTFHLYSRPYIITSEDLLDEVIGSTTFTIDFDLNFHCDVSYTIYQDEEFYAEDSLNYINQFHRQFDLPEDTYDIVFNFSGTGHTYKFSTELDVTPPEPIQSLELTVYGSEVVKLNWETPSGADPVTVYKIYRSTEADFNPLEGTLIATIQPGEELRYEDNTIEPGKTYYYKVISLDRVNNMQTKSVQVEASIPTSPVPIIITFIVIGAIAGAGGFIAYQKITTKKREKMFSEVDLSELDLEEDFDSEMVVEDKMEKWDTIQTKAKAKPAPKPVKTEAGFEFSEGKGKRMSELPAGTYWTQEVKRLLNRAVDYELKGKYGKTLKLYTMVRRIAKQMENDELLHKMQGKIGSLHRDIA
ncbi:MAG: hypothetical protein ACOC44_06120, partial [Promethearchaeia archaeon]